jgi:hypothetical protein
MGLYVLKETIRSHYDSVNALGDASGDVHTLSLQNLSNVSVSYDHVPATTEKL